MKSNFNQSNGRPKHSTNLQNKPVKDSTEVKASESEKLVRGLGQLTVRGTKMANVGRNHCESNKEPPEGEKQKQDSNSIFRRSCSFRSPSSKKSLSDLSLEFQAPTESLNGHLQLLEYFRKPQSDNEIQVGQMKKYSSQTNLNSSLGKSSISLRMTPSSSTSSIPSKVCEF